MSKIFAVAVLSFALSAGAIATSAPAEAAPSYGFSTSDGGVNPFSAVDGR